MKKVSDFAGRYAAAEAGIALGGGRAAVTMKNPHGVVIKLRSVQQGVELTLGTEGIEIKLKE